MQRYYVQRAEQEAARRERLQAAAAAKLPGWKAELERVMREIRRLDPPPPTRDRAAFGGAGSSVARRYRAQFTATRVQQLAKLYERREQLEDAIRRAGGEIDG